MSTIITIFRKEITATLRDKRTLISAVVIPALAMPLLIMGLTRLGSRMNEKENNKQLKIAFINAPASVEGLFQDPKISIIRNVPLPVAKDSVEKENYDAILAFDDRFDANVDSMEAGKISFYYKSTNLMVEKRVMAKLDQYKANVMSKRFEKLHLSQNLLTPMAITNVDVASKKEQLGVMLGGLLPYIFIMFCFIGCLYPSLDMITGEKEKGTLETLLTVPVSRFHILLGKMMAIAVVGVCAAFMTIGGMYVTLRFLNEIPQEIMSAISDILSARFILMLFAMLIPLSFFFAGMLSAIVIRANSFKEAQSYVSPLMFVVLVPAMIALMPGMKLSWDTVWIPILNIALATKEIIAGTIHMSHYIAIVISLVGFALLALAISIRQFSKEKNILK